MSNSMDASEQAVALLQECQGAHTTGAGSRAGASDREGRNTNNYARTRGSDTSNGNDLHACGGSSNTVRDGQRTHAGARNSTAGSGGISALRQDGIAAPRQDGKSDLRTGVSTVAAVANGSSEGRDSGGSRDNDENMQHFIRKKFHGGADLNGFQTREQRYVLYD